MNEQNIKPTEDHDLDQAIKLAEDHAAVIAQKINDPNSALYELPAREFQGSVTYWRELSSRLNQTHPKTKVAAKALEMFELLQEMLRLNNEGAKGFGVTTKMVEAFRNMVNIK